MNLDDLRKPFQPEAISWRVGSTNADKTKGMALCYIDARDVQDRLDAVCGIQGWQCRYVPTHDKKTICEIGILCDFPGYAGPNHPSEWVWKADGAGDSDIEAEKGALSDAFKRAAVRWGVGRYLYDLDSPWVALEAAGRSFKIAPGEYAKLRALLAKDAPKPPADKPEPPPPQPVPGNAAKEASEWALWAIPRIKTMDNSKLDKFQANNKTNIDSLEGLDKQAYDDLKRAIYDRLVELF